jgi:hypothetical protein
MNDDICLCGRVIRQPETGRRRQWCHDCSPPDRRRERQEHVLEAQVAQLPVREPDPDSGLTGATRRALEEWGMLDDWRGVVCIKLAELIDSGRMGASGPAGAVKSHRESMAYAFEHSGQEDDDVIVRLFAEP